MQDKWASPPGTLQISSPTPERAEAAQAVLSFLTLP